MLLNIFKYQKNTSINQKIISYMEESYWNITPQTHSCNTTLTCRSNYANSVYYDTQIKLLHVITNLGWHLGPYYVLLNYIYFRGT